MGRIAGNQQNGPRRLNDDYATDPRWVRVLLNRVKLPGRVWEPAAGTGEIVKVLRRAGYSVSASCITTGHDFLTSRRTAGSIITNPPFSKADDFIKQGLQRADDMLCLLLGWHLIAGGWRRYNEVFSQFVPTRVVIVVERMPLDKTTSQFNHAWVIWDKRIAQRPTILEWASIRELNGLKLAAE